jgi:nucleotide-binding universal stress UspA family protein
MEGVAMQRNENATKHVLIAVDGSDGARRASELAEEWFGDERLFDVTAVNVARTPLVGVPQVPFGGVVGWPWPAATPGADPLVERAMAEEEATAEAVAARQAPSGATIEVSYGDPADAIIHAAQNLDVDLIVVGSNHRGFLERLLGRPVDERLARESPIPVLVVP